ncbi:DUF721 domain-containing protein [Leptolyngbya sp. FACHB-261]|uniref:DUF721 domain-containing protein n=1 Tax=Leptolyngbya sp. FACHB-261 TaxID=2692806 RepID=UPI00168971C8|nr:DUF721 domain-containing protein [Leptolyngbya sp. FACHB-261]MBD2099924.1 DUF721 domain-containing protein [Leptolyngbya sp. FACHB-261]
MAWEASGQVLSNLQNREDWLGGQQFSRILHHWAEIVGPVVAASTRPVSVQRQVLQVAVASSVWAQTLAFERPRILAKLNPLLPEPLADLHFSAARWHTRVQPAKPVAGRKPPLTRSSERPSASAQVQRQLWEAHPSRVTSGVDGSVQVGQAPSIEAHNEPSPELNNPMTAFQTWAAAMQGRSRHLPLCPSCACPTPVGELKHWSMCSVCLARQRRLATFSPDV